MNTLFDLCGGHAALDLVNSLDNRFRDDGPNERLATYADLLRFLVESALLSAPQAKLLQRTASARAGDDALQSVRELRESASATLYALVDGRSARPGTLAKLERYFLDAAQHRELRAQPNIAWHWGRFASDAHLPVWMLSQSVSDLLLSGDPLRHVRSCGVDTCRWLFLDTSKNHSRRWCNMRVCGNRVKARRFQAKDA